MSEADFQTITHNMSLCDEHGEIGVVEFEHIVRSQLKLYIQTRLTDFTENRTDADIEFNNICTMKMILFELINIAREQDETRRCVRHLLQHLGCADHPPASLAHQANWQPQRCSAASDQSHPAPSPAAPKLVEQQPAPSPAAPQLAEQQSRSGPAYQNGQAAHGQQTPAPASGGVPAGHCDPPAPAGAAVDGAAAVARERVLVEAAVRPVLQEVSAILQLLAEMALDGRPRPSPRDCRAPQGAADGPAPAPTAPAERAGAPAERPPGAGAQPPAACAQTGEPPAPSSKSDTSESTRHAGPVRLGGRQPPSEPPAGGAAQAGGPPPRTPGSPDRESGVGRMPILGWFLDSLSTHAPREPSPQSAPCTPARLAAGAQRRQAAAGGRREGEGAALREEEAALRRSFNAMRRSALQESVSRTSPTATATEQSTHLAPAPAAAKVEAAAAVAEAKRAAAAAAAAAAINGPKHITPKHGAAEPQPGGAPAAQPPPPPPPAAPPF